MALPFVEQAGPHAVAVGTTNAEAVHRGSTGYLYVKSD